MSLAILLPGQGSIAPGAGRSYEDDPAFATVERIEAIAARPLRHLLLDDTDDVAAALRTTDAAQLATLALSLVAWEAHRAALEADVVAVAGHSLGQITALVVAGAVSFDDGVRLAAARADACRAADDARPGRLAALLGASPEQAAEACLAAPGECWVANDNAPGQVVIGGTPDGLLAAVEAAKALGVRKAMPLGVGGAFHTPLMQPAADALEPRLASTPFCRSTVPVVDNTEARPRLDPEDWPALLARHLVEPVRWLDVQRTLVGELGVTQVVELAPAGTLTAMAKRSVPEVEIVSIQEVVPSGR